MLGLSSGAPGGSRHDGAGRWVGVVAATTSLLAGCGLTLDANPPDPQVVDDGGLEAGTGDGGMDGGGADGGGADGGCPRGCDDGIPCTVDECVGGTCLNEPDDALCDDGPQGRCTLDSGCQYASCSPESCFPDGPCETAQCDGDTCVKTDLCTGDQTCCAGSCVPAGCSDGIPCTRDFCGDDGCEHVRDDSLCDDGNPCTDDVCGSSGCDTSPNNAPCNDGDFCNGQDSCEGGFCVPSGDSPCSGDATCDASTGTCVGCARDADCPEDIVPDFGPCNYAHACSEMGTQTRTRVEYTCSSGTCVRNETLEMQQCTRDTDGDRCGNSTCTACAPCLVSSGDVCEQDGTCTTQCTDQVCDSGTCISQTRTQTRSCTRNTQGTPCRVDDCNDFGSCTCNRQQRTCTQYECDASESCVPAGPCQQVDTCSSGLLDPNCCALGSVCVGGSCCSRTNMCYDPSCTDCCPRPDLCVSP